MSLRRLLLSAASLLLGAASALATVALHGHWWGLLLGVAATVAALVALAPGWARVPYAGGWAALVAYVVVPRGEGDFVLARDLAGYAVLGTALLVLVLALATLPRRGRVPAVAGEARPAP